MTLEEFNARTKGNATADEYAFIERAYMAAGDGIDKDQFCKDIRDCGLTPTIAALTENVEAANARIKAQRKEIERLAVFIAEQAEEASSAILRAKAVAMMGRREYITWKIKNGKRLWQLDLDLIKDLIRE